MASLSSTPDMLLYNRPHRATKERARKMAAEKKIKFTGNAREWEKLADRLARDFFPDMYPCIYPCEKCGYPVAKGFVCMFGCGTNDPTAKEKSDDK